MEELEWRLYNEIYHTRSENEENNSVKTCSNIEPTKEDTVVDKASLKPRPDIHYFNSKNSLSVSSSSAVPLFIPLENTRQPSLNYPVIQNHVTVSANENSDHNITVNQYTVPVILRSNKINNGKYFTRWATKHQHLLHKKQNRKYNRKQRRMQQKIAQKHSILVYISDDSDDDCVIVNTKTNKQQTKESVTDDDDDDDDAVIFIPPPPPIIINIEEEEERNEHVGESSNTNNEEDEKCTSPQVVLNKFTNENIELLNTPESSNDFLENSTIANNSTNFNFGLHGSDFNTSVQADFARPSNPSHQADFCETESSTASTNDHSGEFNNSVKTIVFDEVEFPKEDIFAEKNLNTFGSLITPKRNSLSKNLDKAEVTESCEQQTQTSQVGNYTSSSSESNAEVSKSLNKTITKKLPNLSPMPPNVTEPNLKEIETPKADNSSDSSSESDYERIIKRTTKNDVNDTHLETEAGSMCKKSKNKRKTDIKDTVENSSFSTNETGEKCSKKKKKKKKRKKEALTFENEIENLGDIPERISCSKKKKYLKNIELDKSKCVQKRKKRVSQSLTGCQVHDSSTNENLENANTIPGENTILSDNSERSKKRRKKSVDSNIGINEKIPDNSDKSICADKISEVEVKLFTEKSDHNVIESNDELHKTLNENVIIISDKPCVIEVDDSSLQNFANLESVGTDLKLANCQEKVICKPTVDGINSLNNTFDVEAIQRSQSGK